MLATENGECYMFIRDGDAVYDWGIQTKKTFHATRDFSPYITFSVPEELEDKYPEGTAYVQMETDFTPETFGVGQCLSITQMMVDGTLYKSSDFFKNFFSTYNVEGCEVDLGDCYRYGYRDYNYNQVKSRQYKGDIGYFQITEFQGDEVYQNWQECVWDYYDFKTSKYNTYATVEMKNLAGLSGGTFVLSDQKPLEEPGEPRETDAPEKTPEATVSVTNAPEKTPEATVSVTNAPEKTPGATVSVTNAPNGNTPETAEPDIVAPGTMGPEASDAATAVPETMNPALFAETSEPHVPETTPEISQSPTARETLIPGELSSVGEEPEATEYPDSVSTEVPVQTPGSTGTPMIKNEKQYGTITAGAAVVKTTRKVRLTWKGAAGKDAKEIWIYRKRTGQKYLEKDFLTGNMTKEGLGKTAQEERSMGKFGQFLETRTEFLRRKKAAYEIQQKEKTRNHRLFAILCAGALSLGIAGDVLGGIRADRGSGRFTTKAGREAGEIESGTADLEAKGENERPQKIIATSDIEQNEAESQQKAAGQSRSGEGTGSLLENGGETESASPAESGNEIEDSKGQAGTKDGAKDVSSPSKSSEKSGSDSQTTSSKKSDSDSQTASSKKSGSGSQTASGKKSSSDSQTAGSKKSGSDSQSESSKKAESDSQSASDKKPGSGSQAGGSQKSGSDSQTGNGAGIQTENKSGKDTEEVTGTSGDGQNDTGGDVAGDITDIFSEG